MVSHTHVSSKRLGIAHQNSLELQELEPVGFEGWAGVEYEYEGVECVGVE